MTLFPYRVKRESAAKAGNGAVMAAASQPIEGSLRVRAGAKVLINAALGRCSAKAQGFAVEGPVASVVGQGMAIALERV